MDRGPASTFHRLLFPASPVTRAIIITVLAVVYAVIGVLVYGGAGAETAVYPMGAAATVLVVAAARFFGASAGALTAGALLLTNVLFFPPPRGSEPVFLTLRTLIYIGLAGIGALVGWLSKTNRRLRRIQDELAGSEKRFRAIADYTYGWEDWIGTDGRLVWVNPAGEKTTGYTVDECFAMRDYPLPVIHPADRGRAGDEIEKGLEGRLPGTSEARCLRKDGSVRWLSISGQPIFDQDGRHLGTRSSMRDITAEKRAGQALRRSEELYRSLFEQSVDGIMIICKGRIVLANGAFSRLHGAPRDELIGTDPLDLLHPDERQTARLRLGRLISGGRQSSGHVYRARRGDGKPIWVDVRSRRIEWNGEPALQTIVRDFTFIKQVEKRLKDSLRKKEVLLQEIHHRVKNNMQMASSLLNMQAKRSDDERVKAALQLSRSRMQTLAMTHEILYRSDSLAEIDMGRHVSRLVSYIRSAFQGPKAIEAEIEADGVTLGLKDAVPVSLIINELVTNSMKHAFPDRDSGKVTVRLSRDETEGCVVLEVKDDGFGLPPEAELEKKPRALGLSLVRSLAEQQLGGSQAVDTGAGTTWTVRFAKS